MAAQAQIDGREIIAIARALARARKFVVWYRDIYDELGEMIEDDEEFYMVEERLYEDIAEGKIKFVYKIYTDTEDSDYDIIVVTPGELSAQQLAALREIARLYAFARWDGRHNRSELDITIHNLVKMWFSDCTKITSPAEAIYALARTYGLGIEEDSRIDGRTYAGSVYYRIEGLDVRVEKSIGYCNYCLDFPNINWSFIEKCVVWDFEDR